MHSMDNGAPRQPTREKSGPLVTAMRRWIMRPSRISAITALSDRFRLIELRGDALKGVAWTPGDKIQVAIGSGFTRRTYTPISWDATTGTTRLLVYLHGQGAGSRWADNLKIGDACDFSGPRRSLDVSALASETIVFGDETSFALATAACQGTHQSGIHCVFEVENTVAAQAVIDQLGLRSTSLIARRPADAHHPSLSQKMTAFMMDETDFLLTGKAASIRYLHHAMKQGGLSASRLRVKAYWAEGKTGLD